MPYSFAGRVCRGSGQVSSAGAVRKLGGCSYLHRVCCRPRVADKCDSATQWRDLHERALIRRHAKGAIKLPAAVLVGDDVAPLTRALPCKDHERSRRPVSHLAVAASAVSKWICRQCDVATAERVGSNRWQHGAGVRTATTVECQPLKGQIETEILRAVFLR